MESRGGWSTSSQSDISIGTEQGSEVSSATQGTQVSGPSSVVGPTQCHTLPDCHSVSQECIKLPGGNTPSPCSDRPPSHLSQVSYNDLCFPKTSNYGSMRKAGRSEVVGRLEERQRQQNQLPHYLATHLHSHL